MLPALPLGSLPFFSFADALVRGSALFSSQPAHLRGMWFLLRSLAGCSSPSFAAGAVVLSLVYPFDEFSFVCPVQEGVQADHHRDGTN